MVGLAGLLDLGYAAFFAIGAYAYAFAASPFTDLDVPFWPMLIVGALVAATFGILLGAPTLRLRGDYLAIVTLGFGEIVPIVILNSEHLHQRHQRHRRHLPAEPEAWRGSSLRRRQPLAVLHHDAGDHGTVVMILLYRLAGFAARPRLDGHPRGRAGRGGNGVNTVTTKLLAFALGASTAGLAGVFNASKLTIVSPDQFGFVVSFTVLAMVVLGGMGNIWGVAVGAFIVYMLQSVFLKQLNIFFDQVPARTWASA